MNTKEKSPNTFVSRLPIICVPEAVETLNLLLALKDIYDAIESMPEIMAEFEKSK